MPIVVGGLGQPEDGALVAAGLGVSGTDPNALHAHLYGSSDITATLTDGATPTVAQGSPHFRGWVIPVPNLPKPKPGALVAHLRGSSALTASLDFALDPDWLAHELAVALLLDLV